MKKKQRQIIALACAAVLAAVLLWEFAVPPRPRDTDLEFWITEYVGSVDFSEYEQHFGWFGAREYLGKGYHFLEGENGIQSYPEQYVSYVISAYPDSLFAYQNWVTDITITDPEVTVYGLTTESSLEEFRQALWFRGFIISESSDHKSIRAARGRFTISLVPGESIHIRANSTNILGIVY